MEGQESRPCNYYVVCHCEYEIGGYSNTADADLYKLR